MNDFGYDVGGIIESTHDAEEIAQVLRSLSIPAEMGSTPQHPQ